MTLPKVTEVPLAMEPTTRDSFCAEAQVQTEPPPAAIEWAPRVRGRLRDDA